MARLALYEYVSPHELSDAIYAAGRELELYPDPYAVEEWEGVLGCLGFTEAKVSYSGFASQGDGASFTGRLSWPERLIRFLAGLPQVDPASGRPDKDADAALEWVAKAMNWQPDPSLAKVLRFHELAGGEVTRSGRYYHQYSVSWEWEHFEAGGAEYMRINEALDSFQSAAKEFVRAAGGTIYRQLEDEYNFSFGEECVLSFIEANYERGLRSRVFRLTAACGSPKVTFCPKGVN